MARAGVYYAQGIAHGLQVHGDAANLGLQGIGKVYGNGPADGGGHLVHQPAGLAEVDVLRPLAKLRYGNSVKLTAAEQAVFDNAQKHLAGCRRGQARAGQHLRDRIGVKPCNFIAALRYEPCHAAHKGGRGLALVCLGEQLVQAYFHQRPALGLEPYPVRAVGRSAGQKVQVHGSGQHAAALMIGMVAADLGTSGRRAEHHGTLLVRVEAAGKPLQHICYFVPAVPAVFEPGQYNVQLAGVQGAAHGTQFLHSNSLLFSVPVWGMIKPLQRRRKGHICFAAVYCVFKWDLTSSGRTSGSQA